MNASTRNNLLLALLLAVTFVAYLPVMNNAFVNYDDNIYIVHNGHVRAGLTWEGVRWAFTTGWAANWHPVTWLSHMLDWQLFGDNPGAHHLVNVGFHLLNVALLFWVLRRMTGALWRSLAVAAFFALHPLHVESVAWVAERKDVLSTMFGLLTLWAYVGYVRQPGPWRYRLVLLWFTLGLLSKPMLVTWPFVLLLLDWWPLGRWGRAGSEEQGAPSREQRAGNNDSRASRLRVSSSSGALNSALPAPRSLAWLLWEKVPFFLLVAGSSVMTYLAQNAGGAVMDVKYWSLGIRLANAVATYWTYLWKLLWPVNLTVFYPLTPQLSLLWVFGGEALLVVTLAVLWRARRQPYLAVGWLWYVGTLVPVIGLVQVGAARMADRYMYIPSIGILVLVVWAVAELAGRWRWARVMAGTATVAALVACGAATTRQVGVWQDSMTLFRRAVAVGEANDVIYYYLGWHLAEIGKREAAILEYRKALSLNPESVGAHYNLGLVLADLARYEEAVVHYREALQREPDLVGARFSLGVALAALGKNEEALREYRKALRVYPDDGETLNNLAWQLATNPSKELRNGAEAVTLARKASKLAEDKDSGMLDTLAAAYAEAGRFAEAVKTAEQALALAQAKPERKLAGEIEGRLQLYRQGQPWREK